MSYGTVAADVIQSSVSGVSLGAGNASIMKNRIINGAMVIDQRNAGASVTSAWPVDRFNMIYTQSSKYSCQQNAGAVTPPVGFSNYLGATSSSAYSVLTGDTFYLSHLIEGYNIADLNWGTADAKTVTLSFWVRSSLTGTFGGSLTNGTSRSYPFAYTISSANTWEQKSVTIAGDTTGTWNKTNGIGIGVWLGLGSGATYSGTAGAWAGSVLVQPTGTTSVVGTNGATFYITGVQLEVGSSATGYEYRQYQQELALCQRYAYVVTSPAANSVLCISVNYNSTSAYGVLPYPVTMRTSPTLTSTTASAFTVLYNNTSAACTTIALAQANQYAAEINFVTGGVTSGNSSWVRYNANSQLAFSAEL